MANKNEFNCIVSEICDYYSIRGKSIPKLAEEIMISERTLQKWKSGGTKYPQLNMVSCLKDFLLKNDGGHFLVRLDRLFGKEIIEKQNEEKGSIKEMDEKDIEIIRENFPGPMELSLLCAVIVYENKAQAISFVLPDGDIASRAALISSYETDMEKAKRIFGFDGIYDWKDKVIKYITCIPDKKGDIESLGQKAVDNILEAYFKKKKERQFYEKEK